MSFAPRNMARGFFPRIAFITLCALIAPPALPALADSSGTPPPSLSEIQATRQAVETRHSQKMQEIQDGLTGQSYDSDTALMLRMRADQEYKARIEQLRIDEQAAYRAMDAKQPHSADSSARAPTSAAIPHFQSQSVITYPQNDTTTAPAEEKPHREGQQKNVGFGTRELEF